MRTETTLQPNDVLLLGSAQPVLGTAMLGEAFGVIKRALVTRTGKRVEVVDDAENLRLLIIANPGFTLTLECCFDANVTPPGLLDAFTIPYIGVTGRVMEGMALMWEAGGERGLSIPVAQWDSMGSAAAYLLNLDGTTTDVA